MDNFREFQAGPDPFGRIWQVSFLWQQTAISIRHSDSVDVKFVITDGEITEEKVMALMHPMLLALCGRTGRSLTDALCLKLAGLHLKQMIETGEDMEKTLVTLSASDLEGAQAALASG
ncbi:MAG: hypothetical protein JJE04_03235 [Acidobacteriia bacterium]|nr:hypothetical protein [Terriglobia bacterium]